MLFGSRQERKEIQVTHNPDCCLLNMMMMMMRAEQPVHFSARNLSISPSAHQVIWMQMMQQKGQVYESDRIYFFPCSSAKKKRDGERM
jgi:hypothetical protein